MFILIALAIMMQPPGITNYNCPPGITIVGYKPEKDPILAHAFSHKPIYKYPVMIQKSSNLQPGPVLIVGENIHDSRCDQSKAGLRHKLANAVGPTIFAIIDGIVKIQEYYDTHPRILVKHNQWLFADFISTNPGSFLEPYQVYNNHLSGTLENIRAITANELFTLLAVIYCGGNPGRERQNAFYSVPESLRNYEFLQWIQQNHKDIVAPPPEMAKILTGAQFNTMFGGPKFMSVSIKRYNDYLMTVDLESGINKHPKFCPVSYPEFGFAFDEDANSDAAARMLITIPDHATVTINYENKDSRRIVRYKSDMIVTD